MKKEKVLEKVAEAMMLAKGCSLSNGEGSMINRYDRQLTLHVFWQHLITPPFVIFTSTFFSFLTEELVFGGCIEIF